MNTPHHHHHEHHDVHQQRLLWFFSFCNQSRSSSSSSSSNGSITRRISSSRRKSASSRNKFAIQYQQQLQQQQKQSSNVFGRDLIEHTQSYSDQDSIPCIVKSCTRFIEKYGIISGIYRLSGMRVNIHKLRQDFDKNPRISMIDNETISNDAHAVACVLKQYFRELPTPLLTFHMYERFIELFKRCNTADADRNYDTNQADDSTTISTTSDNLVDSGVASSRQDKVEANNENLVNINKDACDETKKAQSKAPTIAKCKQTNVTSFAGTTKYKSMFEQDLTSKHTTIVKEPKKQAHFSTSVSDSQLISLSSVVTTTAPDVKYQVKLEDLRQLLLQLPRAHYQTLKFLMRHLAFIAANGHKTGMDSKNVAIVWAPNLLKPRELELTANTMQVIGLQAIITEQMIKHHQFLFDNVDDISTTTIGCDVNNGYPEGERIMNIDEQSDDAQSEPKEAERQADK